MVETLEPCLWESNPLLPPADAYPAVRSVSGAVLEVTIDRWWLRAGPVVVHLPSMRVKMEKACSRLVGVVDQDGDLYAVGDVQLETTFTLTADGLTQTVQATNDSATPALFGTAAHPYLVLSITLA